MDRIDWLKACCDKKRAEVKTPFSVVLDGAVWTIATDVVVFVAVPGMLAPARLDQPSPSLAARFMAPPEGYTIRRATAARLKAWAEKVHGDPYYKADQAPIVFGTMIDRAALARLLSGAPNGPIEVATGGAWNDPVLLHGEGWRGAIMPQRHVVGPIFDGWEP